jgi:hypothetical protein
MWGFFLNSSRLLKDFRKYNMPCHAMHPMQDYFWNVFHMHGKLICNLYALLCWQNFILVKCGCYIVLAKFPITRFSMLSNFSVTRLSVLANFSIPQLFIVDEFLVTRLQFPDFRLPSWLS